MESFKGLFAVVTGGAMGMGQGLVLQLAREGCEVAFCDISESGIAETLKLAAEQSPDIKVTGHVADVAKEEDWIKFREAAMAQHGKSHVRKGVSITFSDGKDLTPDATAPRSTS